MTDIRTVGLERRGFTYHKTHAVNGAVAATECVCDCQLCQAYFWNDFHEPSAEYPSLGGRKWLDYHYD